MAILLLRAPLSELTGGRREIACDGATVGDVLRRLETEHPPIAGWILDERGSIRRHINVFVNGEQGQRETAVSDADRIHVLPSISGG